MCVRQECPYCNTWAAGCGRSAMKEPADARPPAPARYGPTPHEVEVLRLLARAGAASAAGPLLAPAAGAARASTGTILVGPTCAAAGQGDTTPAARKVRLDGLGAESGDLSRVAGAQHRPHRLVADPEVGGEGAEAPCPGEGADRRLLLN